MAKKPVLKPREVVRLLTVRGFVEVRQRGSHKQFRHSDGRATTVPFHKGRDISPALLRQIARDIGMTVEAFLELPETQESADSESPSENASLSDTEEGDVE